MSDRRPVRRFALSVGAGTSLLGLSFVMRHGDPATDGSRLAVSVLRAAFDAGERLDVTAGGWLYIVGLAVAAMFALPPPSM